MSRRVSDWPTKLAEFIEQRRKKPFVWGKYDCCLFAADSTLLLTGIDMASDLRGQYSGWHSATRLVHSLGGIERIVEDRCAEHGFDELTNRFSAQRGDIVICEFDDASGPSVGVCVGKQCAFTYNDGLIFYPLALVQRSWRID